MIPGQVTIIPNFLVMSWLGWVDTYAALIIPAAFSAFGTFLLRQFFLSIPPELEQAARMDGCSYFGIYRHIILPLSGPALATLAVFAFMTQWNAFLWPLIVTNKETMRTLTVGIRYFGDEAAGAVQLPDGRDRDEHHPDPDPVPAACSGTSCAASR